MLNEPVKITMDQLIETVREVAEERPDYVYANPFWDDGDTDATSCQYVHGSEPGCIFGHAFNRLGVPLATLIEYEGNGIDVLLPELETDGVIEVVDGYTDTILDVFAAVQGRQDAHFGPNRDTRELGLPWGEAVLALDEEGL